MARKGSNDWLRKWWGYLALFVVIVAWISLIAGKVAASAVAVGILVLSVAAGGYFLFLAPVGWCRAEGRQGACRNNTNGLLRGCHIRQHKWQRLTMALRARRWRELGARTWAMTEGKAATLGGLGSAVSGVAAVAAILVVHH
jgi:hypothetical protein